MCPNRAASPLTDQYVWDIEYYQGDIEHVPFQLEVFCQPIYSRIANVAPIDKGEQPTDRV